MVKKRCDEFGKTLKELRLKQNMTQENLAELIDKTTGAIGQLERGEIFPGYETLKKIIEVFNVDVNIFFFGKEMEYSIETMWILKLFSTMNDEDKKIIGEFLKKLVMIITLNHE